MIKSAHYVENGMLQRYCVHYIEIIFYQCISVKFAWKFHCINQTSPFCGSACVLLNDGFCFMSSFYSHISPR